MKGYLIKAPEGMLERWKQAALMRKMTTSQMVREAVNKDIDHFELSLKPFSQNCPNAGSHTYGVTCLRCSGSK